MTDLGRKCHMAIDELGKLVDIYSFCGNRAEARSHTYTCPQCREKMIPVMGEVRIAHFRHMATSCGYDNYLHGAAEECFIEEYNHCLEKGIPFYFEMNVPVRCNKGCVLKKHYNCKERYIKKTFDLTKYFKKVSREVRVDIQGQDGNTYRIPDIYLERENGVPLWIEICVSHETRPLENPNDGKIIEIKINSEEDIKRIFKGHKITQSDDREKWVRLHNFGNIDSDEPIPAKPPCEKYYVYDTKPYGYSRIVETIPKDNGGSLYRAVMKLNFGKDHEDPGEANVMEKYDESDLLIACRMRFANGRSNDPRIDSLFVKEYRSVQEKEENAITGRGLVDKPVVHPLQNNTVVSEVTEISIDDVQWIDLGLPSGTLWCEKDTKEKPSGSMPGYCEPSLPSANDIKELKDYCEQVPKEEEDKVLIVGPNERSIILEAAQYPLSDLARYGGRKYCRIYALIDYLHIIEDDDKWGGHWGRYVLHKR